MLLQEGMKFRVVTIEDVLVERVGDAVAENRVSVINGEGVDEEDHGTEVGGNKIKVKVVRLCNMGDKYGQMNCCTRGLKYLVG